MDIEHYRDWTGSGDELAQVAGELLAQDKRTAQQTPPNLRVLRDYQQRQIVSAPDRQGREAVYDFRHLIQFLTARVLVADNWPLRKIASAVPNFGSEELVSILKDGRSMNTPAQRQDDDQDHPPAGLVAGMTYAAPNFYGSYEDRIKQERRRLADRFPQYVSDIYRKRSDLDDFFNRYSVEGEATVSKPSIRIEVLPWLSLLVDEEVFDLLNFEDAEAIGKGITATIYNIITREND